MHDHHDHSHAAKSYRPMVSISLFQMSAYWRLAIAGLLSLGMWAMLYAVLA